MYSSGAVATIILKSGLYSRIADIIVAAHMDALAPVILGDKTRVGASIATLLNLLRSNTSISYITQVKLFR